MGGEGLRASEDPQLLMDIMEAREAIDEAKVAAQLNGYPVCMNTRTLLSLSCICRARMTTLSLARPTCDPIREDNMLQA